LALNNLKILLLPGWLNSDPLHWQSRWEQLYGDERITQHDWETPLRGDWITRLEDVVQSAPTDQRLILVAHSLGCHLVAAWAQVSVSAHRVQGALLVAPPDIARADMPAGLHSWRKPVLGRLPFTAVGVISSDDPFCGVTSGLQLCQAWGTQCVNIGSRGHINAASDLGDWPEGRRMLLDLAGRQNCVVKAPGLEKS
jgi:uncharacterized protein